MLNKTLVNSAALALMLGLAACGEKTEEPGDSLMAKAKDAVEEVSSMTPEAMGEKVTEIVNDVKTQLGSIKDEAAATEAVEKLKPMLDQLKTLKTSLGDKMPDLGELKTTATDLAGQFLAKPEIAKILQPILDQIKELAG